MKLIKWIVLSAVLCANTWATPIQWPEEDGEIFAWGRDLEGQCNVPIPNTDFTAIAAGWLHSLGLKIDGSIVAWGDNEYDQCNVPPPNSEFVAVDAGEFHNLGLKTDSTIVAWGYNHYGQCAVPPPNTNFVAVGGGGSHSLGLKTDGSIVAWGLNDFGISTVPSPNTNFVAVAAGGTHSLGLKSDTSIVAWGKNYHGQCDVPSPNEGFVAIECGGQHSMGLKSDGTIVAWGYNEYGQCDVPSPNEGFVAIECGGHHSLGIKEDGSIIVWGNNVYGQHMVPSPNTDYTAIAADGFHSLGLKGDPIFTIFVADVLNDQGGYLEVSWEMHVYDSGLQMNPVVEYEVQRLGDDWHSMTTVTATQSDFYNVVVPTEDILVLGEPAPYSQYRVVARTEAPLHLYASSPDSGFSIDNLPPNTPELTLYDDVTYRYLHWQSDDVFDLSETCLYRGSGPGFETGEPLVCSEETDFWYIEDDLARYYYRVRSFDIHGNASEWSSELVGMYPTAMPGAQITEMRLYPNYPNPFNPSTTIKFAVPHAGHVCLNVYDLAGHLIRTLVDEDLSANAYTVIWDGNDTIGQSVPSGAYFYRLTAGGYSETRRMVLVK